MFRAIIRKELLLNLVSFRFVVSVVLLSALIIGSMQMMAVNYSRRLQDYSTGVEMHNNDIASIDTRLQFEAFGVTRDPRPAMLGIFSIGLEGQMSRSFMVPGFSMPGGDGGGGGGGGNPMFQNSKLVGIMPEGSKYSNPIFMLFMPPDYVYVINIVLSLLALLFSFDTISGEKEDQTLKLILTNAVPRDTLLLGKWIGGTLSIWIPFMIAFGIGILSLIIRPDISFTNEAPMRIGLILMASLLYIAIFFLLGMVFSVSTPRASTSLILSLFAWVFFVLVAPNIAPVIARQIVHLPSTAQVVREAERLQDEMRREQDGEKKNEMKEEIPKRVEQLEARWLNSLENQTRLAINISRISPSANFVYFTSAVSGTGIEDYKRLRDEIFRHRQELGKERPNFIKPDKSKPIPMLYIKVLTKKIPGFEDKRLVLDESLSGVLIDLGVMMGYLALLFMITFFKFLRYDVK